MSITIEIEITDEEAKSWKNGKSVDTLKEKITEAINKKQEKEQYLKDLQNREKAYQNLQESKTRRTKESIFHY